MPKKTGAPATKNIPEVRDTLLLRLSHGESLRAICRDKAAGMPDVSTVFDWIHKDETFAKQYARARELQADMLVDEILEIADDSAHDVVESLDDKGNIIERVNHDHINRSRLRVDTRKWFASKVFPKRYGDKQEIEHSGKIESITVNVIKKEPPKT
jgi:hypothetical protein